ncbi:hypothetical protein DERF_010446 [Dermatophagoides farinae]|uniref:Uncharacterized protein n=1 Tax=Dermatophagoides farinae TaxID=6954 RepID=A0A922L2K5_DERFA|nr:hypothetical protein DERF_010446 [Dermatophagoides farinae]
MKQFFTKVTLKTIRFGQSVIALFHSRTKSSSTIGVSHSLETIQENIIRNRSFKGSIIPNGSKIRPIVDKTIRLVKDGETKSRFFKLIASSDIFHTKPSKPESSPVEPPGIIPLEHILCISKPAAENACLASITHCRRSSILFEPIRRSSIYVTPENTCKKAFLKSAVQKYLNKRIRIRCGKTSKPITEPFHNKLFNEDSRPNEALNTIRTGEDVDSGLKTA